MLKWSFLQIQKSRNGFPVDEVVDLTEILHKKNKDVRSAKSIHVSGRLVTQRDQVTVTLKVTGVITLPCARTLVDVPYPLDISINEIMVKDIAEFSGSDDVYEITDNQVDLMPIIEECVLVDIPMQVYAAESNKASKSGNGWIVVSQDDLNAQEQQSEDAEAPKGDSRLAVLADYFKKDE
ncbi:YceD family protein [Brochothrix thermosphacta]|uniref:YceD family protein n=1 Tax=Brochothrix thermosphacta TaxID=2756 RepID=UPI000E75452A|nr:YceD family protein [Brochothrix thermosphacta]